MLAHVLVPLDGSELAKSALDYALGVVDDKTVITLLTVLRPPEVAIYDFYPLTVNTPKDYETTFAETLQMAQKYLKHVAYNIEEQYPNEVHIEIEVGEPAAVIADTAAKLKVDAIIMSTHGRSGISRWLFGSVTQKVLTSGCCPVLVIPPHQIEDEKPPAPEGEQMPA